MALLAKRPPPYSVPGYCVIAGPPVRSSDAGLMLDTVLDGVHGDVNMWVSDLGAQQLASKYGEHLGIALRDELKAEQALRKEAQRQRDEALNERDELAEQVARFRGVVRDGFKIVRQTGPLKQEARA